VVHGRAGKIRELCELVDKYGDELESDFTQFYSIDIADVWRGLLSARRALVIAGQLGTIPGSRFRACILGGPEFIGWSREAQVLADLFDALVDNSVVTAKVAGGKPSSPTPYPRPVPAEDKAAVVDVPTIDDFPIHMVMALTARK